MDQSSPTGPFGRLARQVLRHRRWAVVLVLLALALAGWSASRLAVDSNLLVLLPQDEPTIQALERIQGEGGGLNVVTVAADGEPEAARALLADIEARLAGSERVAHTLLGLDPELSWRLGLLQLQPAELESIRDRLRGALALGPAIANPFIAGSLLDLGPMTRRLQQASAERMLLSENGLQRLLVLPVRPPQDIAFARGLMAEIDRAIAEAAPRHPDAEIVWVGGAYRHNVEDYEGVVHDMRWTGLASFLLVFTLLTLAFRDARVLILVFTPLLVGTAWTFGFAGAYVGQLNTFTGFFGAVLIGLGIDFSIHLYTRYREERATASTLDEAVVRAWDRVGPPCLAAALTSAGGFLALTVARFQGFAQLGVLLAAGVMLCLVAVLVLMPVLIHLRERRPTPYPRRSWGGVERGAPPTYRYAPLALLLLVLVTVASLSVLPRVQFEYDLSELRRDGMAFDDLTPQQRALVRDSYTPLVVELPDREAVAAWTERLQARMDRGDLPEIQRLLSELTLIPLDQERRLAILREISEMARSDQARFLPAQVRANLDRIAHTDLRPLTVRDLPPALQALLGSTRGGSRLLLVPSGNMWDLRQTAHLLEVVQRELPGLEVASQYLALGRLYQIVRGDAPRVVAAAIVLVILATLVDVRRPVQAVGTVLVLLSGMVWAGAAMAGLRIKLSIVNFVGIPILLGIGVDVVIHLLHRIREEGPGRIRKAIATTGWAAGLSALTTVLSFASLAFASSRGIRSLGLLVLVGLTLVTLAAFSMLPTGWMTAWKLGGEAPEDRA